MHVYKFVYYDLLSVLGNGKTNIQAIWLGMLHVYIYATVSDGLWNHPNRSIITGAYFRRILGLFQDSAKTFTNKYFHGFLYNLFCHFPIWSSS